MGYKIEPIQTFEEFEIGSYKLNTTTRMLTRNGINKKLSKTDTNFIAYLCANKGKDIKRSDCVNAIWGENTYKNLRIMDVYIHRIRKNLKDDTSIYLINLHGKGYRFIF